MRLTFATDVSPAVIDLETAGHPLAPTWLEPVQPDARLKDPDKIKADIIAKEATRLERLALDWNVGRIVALGIWTQTTGYEVLLCHDETEERAAIEACWALTQHRTIVGFNFKGFDGRYLIQRSRLLGIPARDLDLGKYSRKGSVVDLFQDLTFNDGHYDQGAMRRTLKAFCRRFDIPVDDAIEGSQMQAIVDAGDWASVHAHCLADLRLTVALAQRLRVLPDALPLPLPLEAR